MQVPLGTIVRESRMQSEVKISSWPEEVKSMESKRLAESVITMGAPHSCPPVSISSFD